MAATWCWPNFTPMTQSELLHMALPHYKYRPGSIYYYYIISSSSSTTTTHISVEIRKQWFRFIQQCDSALSADVCCRQCFHLARQKQFAVLQLMLLLFRKILFDRFHAIVVIFFKTTCTAFQQHDRNSTTNSNKEIKYLTEGGGTLPTKSWNLSKFGI